MRVLVSGASSGLGKYLKEHFSADAYVRGKGAPSNNYDTIIHCAFNLAQNVAESEMPQYEADTLGLTNTLLSIPHGKFIFISTVDVYPKDGKRYAEDTVYDIADIAGMYGATKLRAEKLVLQGSENTLILRCASLLGKTMRPNSVMRILSGENPTVSVAADSEYNFVLYEDVAALIGQDPSGIFNVAATGNARLANICNHFGKQATFGKFRYLVGNIDNRKSAAIVPALRNSSIQQLERFIGL